MNGRPIKRIEIVVGSLQVETLVGRLDAAGATGYTVVPASLGRGSRGLRRGDDLTGALRNAVVVTLCEPEALDGLLEAVRPLLARSGGVCVVSDALRVD